MKKLILSIAAAFTMLSARADEGMWIPMLIGKNIESMQKAGFKLTADDIYNVNNASLKDAVVHFGGGCTGEIISSNGLLITNHHCGYGNIASLSSVEHNYLENGFWAKSFAEELPAPGLSVKFLVRMEDVTAKLASVKKNEKKYKKTYEQIKADAEEGGKYMAQISPYFNGNQQILLVYEVYTDVRLVGTPPKSLGKYGGDTDNWMWPRHTADFSMFRVYANKDNKPAAYSKDNVPYKPKKFLDVSIAGQKEGDYSMIMGYPGRTNRYETSYGVDMAISEVNPSTVKIRDMRLGIMRAAMRKDPAVNLKLASNYASIANYWKYFIGQTEQLKRLNVVKEKRDQETSFTNWAKTNSKVDADLMTRFDKLYRDYRPYAKHNTYYSECFNGAAVAKLGGMAFQVKNLMEDAKTKPEDLQKAIKGLQNYRKSIIDNMDVAVEKEMLARTAEMFYNDIPTSQQPSVYNAFIFKKFGADNKTKAFDDFSAHTFANSFLLDDTKFTAFINNPSVATLSEDPAVIYAESFINNYNNNYKEKQVTFNNERNVLAQQYIKGLMNQHPDKQFYPDANSTMRVTYGSVKGYNPQDAVTYNYYTTMEGLIAKYKPNDYEFDLPAKFLDLYEKKDYGRYVNEKGELVTCFISNNDITGGNSGSPIMNSKGQLIGLAFDGNWEAMSGDIAFDKEYKRTINVDIRFVLWIIEKYGNATNLIEEMNIVK